MSQYVGTYFSQDYIMRNVLQYSDEDIAKMQKQIKTEEPIEPPEDEG
jgi:hypothetical protein